MTSVDTPSNSEVLLQETAPAPSTAPGETLFVLEDDDQDEEEDVYARSLLWPKWKTMAKAQRIQCQKVSKYNNNKKEGGA